MVVEQWVTKLRKYAERVPGDGPLFHTARDRALRAVEIVATAFEIDPTLVDDDRRRSRQDLDLLIELLRQLYPLARQAEAAIEPERLEDTSAPHAEITRLRQVDPLAPEEFDALSAHLGDIAQCIADQAQPDWASPARIRERSERRLPSRERLVAMAQELQDAVQPALELEYPAPAAVQLAGLAKQLLVVAGARWQWCAGPGCAHRLEPATTGRPRIYCGPTCRQRARRAAAKTARTQSSSDDLFWNTRT